VSEQEQNDKNLIETVQLVQEAQNTAEHYIVERELKINALERQILEAKKLMIDSTTSLAGLLSQTSTLKLTKIIEILQKEDN
jgi:hypothetical protein